MIEKLCTLRTPILGEWEMGKYLYDELAACADEVFHDGLGNIIARKKGDGERLMLVTSAYEAGVMCVYIEENGLLRFEAEGNAPPEQLLGRRVEFEHAAGVIGCEEEKPAADKLYIDIGAKTRAEAEKAVSIGSIAMFYSPCQRLMGDRVTASGISQRAKCAALLKTAQKNAPPKYDTYFVIARAATPSKPHGIYTPQNIVEPSLSIAIDAIEASFAGKTPRPAALGQGPAIKLKDSSMIAHKTVIRLLTEAAKSIGFEAPFEVSAQTSASGSVHTERGGIPSGALSIPCSFLGSFNEIICEGDVWRAAEILSAVIYGE